MKKICIQVSALLLVGILPLFSWTSARAEEMTCPTHTLVNIDIRPGGYPNSLKLSSNGLVPVAVLTTQDFDASHFIPEMAHLFDSNTAMSQMCAGASAVHWKLDDVNQDGRLDLVFFFSMPDLDLTVNSTAATFMAHGSYGSTVMHIIGTDAVQTIP
jgi:hypothetical protein